MEVVGCKFFFKKSLFGKFKSGEVGAAHWEPVETMVPVCVSPSIRTQTNRGRAMRISHLSIRTPPLLLLPPKLSLRFHRYGVQARTLIHL